MILRLKPLVEQTSFNLRRWTEILADPDLAKLPHRIETDRHGHIIMSPPPTPSHGSRQLEIGRLRAELMPHGNSLSECPLSTSDGVKAIDVAWLSDKRSVEAEATPCLTRAPEICVEILSPSNTTSEIQEKIALYLEAGAQEVWVCGLDGRMTFNNTEGQMGNPCGVPPFRRWFWHFRFGEILSQIAFARSVLNPSRFSSASDHPEKRPSLFILNW